MVDILIASLVVIAFAAVFAGIAAWAAGDAQKRGYDGGTVFILLFLLVGPCGVFIWLLVRPKARLNERSAIEYGHADGALAAASRLDSLGDWDAAITVYQDAAQRWPEHEDYIQRCIEAISEKQAMS